MAGDLTRAVVRLWHPALEPGGRPLDPQAQLERIRLSLLAQGAGLLALLEEAGWALAAPWSRARLDGLRLAGLEVRPGAEAKPAERLVAWIEFLFESLRPAGRSRARKVLRELADRWTVLPLGWSVRDWLGDLLDRMPELERSEEVLSALRGRIDRGQGWEAWKVVRRGPGGVDGSEEVERLLASGRFVQAVERLRSEGGASRGDRWRLASALFGSGRLEAALGVLEGDRSRAAERLRFNCQLQLGQLQGARQTLRRLENGPLELAERLDLADSALRFFALAGEPDRARAWVSELLRRTRGEQRLRSELFAAFQKLDAGEIEEASVRLRRLERRMESRPRQRLLWLEASAELAFLAGDGARLLELACEILRQGRRGMTVVEAGRAWNRVGLGRDLTGDLSGAERAYGRAMRLLSRADGPLKITLAGANWAEVRLRRGLVEGVEEVLQASERENLRSGNSLGLLFDRLLGLRLQLVRGELAQAVESAFRHLEEALRLRTRRGSQVAAALGARAAAWLGDSRAALELLGRVGEGWQVELEPEEIPFLTATLGLKRVDDSREGWGWLDELLEPLARGEIPDSRLFEASRKLDPYRRARLVLDVETLVSGAAPRELREEAERVFRRLGADLLAARLGRVDARAWSVLGKYLAGPSGDGPVLRELLEALGHPAAEVVWRGPGQERRLLEGCGSPAGGSTLVLGAGGGELHLKSWTIDEPLRAVGALLARELERAGEGRRLPVAGPSPFVGESPALRRSLDRLARFADSEMPVLLLGENGTGKELAARWVHAQSPRRHQPFVPFNCAGLTESLQHSELFGHVRGAFTGADRARLGVFEQASGGSLFLDEIGDLPLSAQGSILRALQEGEIRRVGESLPRKVDVRLIAATHRDLERMVEDERFREDLFYRLKVAVVRLPPLRERSEDVLLLAEEFLARLRQKMPRLTLSQQSKRSLLEYSWPGNVRQLRHVLEAAALLAEGGTIEPRHLDLGGGAPAPEPAAGSYHQALEETRKRLLAEALAEARGNRAAAARKLGISRQNFSYLARRYGLFVS